MAKKRKRAAKAAPLNAAETDSQGHDMTETKTEDTAHAGSDTPQAASSASALTPYEVQRQQLIERNRARLLELGIPVAVVGVQVAVQAEEHNRPKQAAKSKPKPPSKQKAPAPAPRRSTRLTEHAELQQEADEALSQGDRDLAMFIIDGECPKCGKVMSRGHRQHFATCAGVEEPTEEECLEEAERRRLNKENKLLALSLRGLVDFTPELAKFIVLGSTGNPYPVTLRSDKRTCACVDHRVRKHDCKHIRLILKQLDIEGEPSNWRQAVERHFQSQLSTLADAGGGTAGGATIEGVQGEDATKRNSSKRVRHGLKTEEAGKHDEEPKHEELKHEEPKHEEPKHVPVDSTRAQALKFM